MMLKMYSVFDSAVQGFERPFAARSHGEVLREFTDMLAEGKSKFAKNPHDFTIYYIGDFNDSTGVLDCFPKVSIGVMSELIAKN